MTIKVWTSQGTLKFHKMICYGMEDITKVDRVLRSERLEQFSLKLSQENWPAQRRSIY